MVLTYSQLNALDNDFKKLAGRKPDIHIINLIQSYAAPSLEQQLKTIETYDLDLCYCHGCKKPHLLGEDEWEHFEEENYACSKCQNEFYCLMCFDKFVGEDDEWKCDRCK